MGDQKATSPQAHPFEPAVRFDGGDLDCGSGLLLQIRRHIDPLDSGQLLEIRSTEPSVAEDLPAWCRMTGNELVSTRHDQNLGSWSFLIAKNRFGPAVPGAEAQGRPNRRRWSAATFQASPASARAGDRGKNEHVPEIAPFSVMGIGSWPRPDWLLRSSRSA